MKKSEMIKKTEQIEEAAKAMLEKVNTLGSCVSSSMQAARRLESRLIEKEHVERTEEDKRKKEERLREYLEADTHSGVYVSDVEEQVKAGSKEPVAVSESSGSNVKTEHENSASREMQSVDSVENATEVKAKESVAEDSERNINKQPKTEHTEEDTASKNAGSSSATLKDAENKDNHMESEVKTAENVITTDKTNTRKSDQSVRPKSGEQGSLDEQDARNEYQERRERAERSDRADSRSDRPERGDRNRAAGIRRENSTNNRQTERTDAGYDRKPYGEQRTQRTDTRNARTDTRTDTRTDNRGSRNDNGYDNRGEQRTQRSDMRNARTDNRGSRSDGGYDNRGEQRTQRSDMRNSRTDTRTDNRGSRNDNGYDNRGEQRTGFDRTGRNTDFANKARDNSSAKPARSQSGRTSAGNKRPGGEPPIITKEVRTPDKGSYVRTFDNEKKTKNKKTIMKETAPSARGWEDDGQAFGSRKRKQQKPQIQHKPEPVVIEKAIITTETISVRDFSEKIGKPAAEIIKKLFLMGIVANINQDIDFDTCELVAMDYNIELEHQVAKTLEETMQESADEADTEENLVERPPVVTIMGHVDHGKTSLLDAIRNSAITAGEAGGITQHIGAYTVNCNGRTITFIDTPGHAAFTSMRARGAQVTDVVILVVAADDGIMPQTVEAINHAKAAEVPIVVAINKIDKPEANPEKIKQQLTEHGLVCDDWGGDVFCVPISAKKHINLDKLLETVLFQADVLELRANPNRNAKGTIIEAKLDKGRGPIATVLVQNGTLKVGDPIVAGVAYGKVRAMMDDKGKSVKTAGPSCPVEVLGFNEVPSAGDIMNVADVSRKVAEERRDKLKAEQLKSMAKVSLEDLFNQIAEGEMKNLSIVVKADVHGSVEAVKQALEKLSNEEVRVKVIHGGVGAITESDVMFASASNAIVIGFNVRPDSGARALAAQEKVDVRTYRVIYQAIEDVEKAMKGMFKPVYQEVHLGTISVRNTFKVSGIGTIAGAYVQEGKVQRNALVRVVRDGIVIHEGQIASLRRFKDDVKEVASGYECGIGIEDFNDIHEGDVIEAYIMEQVQR